MDFYGSKVNLVSTVLGGPGLYSETLSIKGAGDTVWLERWLSGNSTSALLEDQFLVPSTHMTA